MWYPPKSGEVGTNPFGTWKCSELVEPSRSGRSLSLPAQQRLFAPSNAQASQADSAGAQLERAARGPRRLGGRTSETAAPAFAPGYGFVSVVRGRWRSRPPTVTFLALAYGTAEERKERRSPSGLAPNFTGRHRCSQDSSLGSPVGFPQGNIHALNSSRRRSHPLARRCHSRPGLVHCGRCLDRKGFRQTRLRFLGETHPLRGRVRVRPIDTFELAIR